jgi:hypothetical protein
LAASSSGTPELAGARLRSASKAVGLPAYVILKPGVSVWAPAGN